MSSTSETPIVPDGPSLRTTPADAYAHVASVTIILPSEPSFLGDLADSDAFEIVFGETLELGTSTVRLRSEAPIEARAAILQFDWPDRGAVMLGVDLEPELGAERHVYTALINDVL